MGKCSNLAWTPGFKINVKGRKRWGSGPGLAMSGRFPSLPRKADRDHRGWPPGGANAQVELSSSDPPPPPNPTRTPFKPVSQSPSLCWLSLHLLTHSAPFPHSFQSLFFLSFFFLKTGKQSEKYDYKMPVGFQGGGKKETVSIRWLQPSLGPKRWCVGWGRGRGKPRACLKSLDPSELTL